MALTLTDFAKVAGLSAVTAIVTYSILNRKVVKVDVGLKQYQIGGKSKSTKGIAERQIYLYTYSESSKQLIDNIFAKIDELESLGEPTKESEKKKAAKWVDLDSIWSGADTKMHNYMIDKGYIPASNYWYMKKMQEIDEKYDK